VAATDPEYVEPTVAVAGVSVAGRESGVAAVMVKLSCAVAVNLFGEPESVTVKVGLKFPAQEAVMVPVIAPVLVFSVRQEGKEPLVSAHV
jgi:hypothetical protein